MDWSRPGWPVEKCHLALPLEVMPTEGIVIVSLSIWQTAGGGGAGSADHQRVHGGGCLPAAARAPVRAGGRGPQSGRGAGLQPGGRRVLAPGRRPRPGDGPPLPGVSSPPRV